jgi:hypothetical protein
MDNRRYGSAEMYLTSTRMEPSGILSIDASTELTTMSKCSGPGNPDSSTVFKTIDFDANVDIDVMLI